MCVDPLVARGGGIGQDRKSVPFRRTLCGSDKGLDNTLWRSREDWHNRVQFRYMEIFPAVAFFMIDPEEEKGLIKVEIYTRSATGDVTSRPHFMVPLNLKRWRHIFLEQWQFYWEARVPLTRLQSGLRGHAPADTARHQARPLPECGTIPA